MSNISDHMPIGDVTFRTKKNGGFFLMYDVLIWLDQEENEGEENAAGC